MWWTVLAGTGRMCCFRYQWDNKRWCSRISLSKRSKSLKTYQMSKHCTAVPNSVGLDFFQLWNIVMAAKAFTATTLMLTGELRCSRYEVGFAGVEFSKIIKMNEYIWSLISRLQRTAHQPEPFLTPLHHVLTVITRNHMSREVRTITQGYI